MTKLVGQDGTGWTQVSSFEIGTTGSEYRVAGGYVATAGVGTTLHFQMGTGGTATLATAYVYSGSGPGATFLYMTPEFSVAPGDNTVGISVALSAATYLLCIQAASGSLPVVINSGSASNVGRQNLVSSFPYRTPPGTMPTANVASGREFIIWISGGIAYSLSAAPIATVVTAKTIPDLHRGPHFTLSATAIAANAAIAPSFSFGLLSLPPPPAPPGSVIVPNVVGMYFYDAQLALLGAGLRIAPPQLVDSVQVTAIPGISLTADTTSITADSTLYTADKTLRVGPSPGNAYVPLRPLGIVTGQDPAAGSYLNLPLQPQVTITVAAYLSTLPPLIP